MLRYFFTFQVLEELLDKLLLLISSFIKVLFQRIVDLLILFLSLSLISAELVLLLQFGPYLQLVDEVTQELVRLIQDILKATLLVNPLQAMSVNIYKESVCVCILGHR